MLDLECAIEQISAVDWFAHVGERGNVDTPLTICWRGSWTEAVTVRGMAETSDAFTEGKNILTCELGRNFRDHYRRKWNKLAYDAQASIYPTICLFIDRLIDGNAEIRAIPHGVPFVKGIVRWDLICFAMEHIYSDLVPPRFYHAVFAVYQAGHFPCNWDERWPDGTLDVF